MESSEPQPPVPGPGSGPLARSFLEHREAIFAYLLAHVRDYNAAEDLFQEVGMTVLAAGQRGVAPDNVLAWCLTVARNQLVDHVRRQSAHRATVQSVEVLGEVVDQAFREHPPEPEDTRRRISLLRDCLGRLGAKARALVDCRYQEGASSRDIADRFGWSEPAVRVALAKARRALADCVGRKLRRDGAP